MKENIYIPNSFCVSKRYFDRFIASYVSSGKPMRSMFSMKMEWAVHNALYALGLWRKHTKDVNLEYPQKKWLTVIYCVFGIIVWPFIK